MSATISATPAPAPLEKPTRSAPLSETPVQADPSTEFQGVDLSSEASREDGPESESVESLTGGLAQSLDDEEKGSEPQAENAGGPRGRNGTNAAPASPLNRADRTGLIDDALTVGDNLPESFEFLRGDGRLDFSEVDDYRDLTAQQARANPDNGRLQARAELAEVLDENFDTVADLNGDDGDVQRNDLNRAFGNRPELTGERLLGQELDQDDIRPDLARSDLRLAEGNGLDLSETDLRGSDLLGFEARGADLRGANLRSTDLQEADLGFADLRGADLTGAQNGQTASLRFGLVDDETVLPEGVTRRGRGLTSVDSSGNSRLYNTTENQRIRAMGTVQGRDIAEDVAFIGGFGDETPTTIDLAGGADRVSLNDSNRQVTLNTGAGADTVTIEGQLSIYRQSARMPRSSSRIISVLQPSLSISSSTA